MLITWHPRPTSRAPGRITSVSVQNVELKQDGQYHFTTEVRRDDNTRHVLFRVYDDFWALQVALLNHFPVESGRKNSPRVIPFLPPPSRDTTPTILQQRQQQLDAYLSELVKLPHHIMDSFPVKRFFMLRKQDIETSLDIGFDVSGTLMDLIHGYNDSGQVKVKLCVGDEIVAWKVPDTVTYRHLLRDVEYKLNMRVPALAYKDECNMLIPLQGDSDLGLLIRTNSHKLVFYVYDPYAAGGM
ncbi:bud emergence protein 1 [Quaeritorhiza haematococci]|nr:bud emergence protein 1 [Quaeritorhiza haematococci]